jgi:hypothetical protein
MHLFAGQPCVFGGEGAQLPKGSVEILKGLRWAMKALRGPHFGHAMVLYNCPKS